MIFGLTTYNVRSITYRYYYLN